MFAVCVVGVRGQQPAKDNGEKNTGRKVTAMATATYAAKPDGARLNFVVTTTEATDKSPREANEKRVKALTDTLVAIKLKDVNVEVRVVPSGVSTLATAPAGLTDSGAVQAKRARSTFCVTIRAKDQDKLHDAVSRLAEAAAEGGGTAVETDRFTGFSVPRFRRGGFGGAVVEEPESVPGPTIEWLATPSAEARREAIQRAVKEALADAQAAVGQEKLNVVEIDVKPSETTPNYLSRDNGVDNSGSVPMSVAVRVTCSY
jgi:hypothetical protein